MGEHKVKTVGSSAEKARFVDHLIKDITALDQMIMDACFEQGIQRIGAEQELAVLDTDCDPAFLGPEILDNMTDPRFTTEIGRFNLEINLDPVTLAPDCLSRMETQLKALLQTAKTAADDLDSRILLCGILPTLTYQHLHQDAMTPNPRYHGLSKMMREMRGRDFEVFLLGVDDMMASLDNLVFESCNTSFQLHLQIPPEEFVERYNWAQMISGPVLAACANSPLLFGRELWMETRIALFQQAVDTRTSANQLRNKQPRVFFGNRWLQHSISELFKDNAARFPVLLIREIDEDGMTALRAGKAPELSALRLHNGTVYNWNRPCYGVMNGLAHLRIECRYIPSGPTQIDEMANFAFWLGLMTGMPARYKGFYKYVSFRSAKDNFFRAARIGLNSIMDWFGKATSAENLIRKELLPIAREGLLKSGICAADADRYLNIIDRRIESHQTGAAWQVRNYRKLRDNFGSAIALTELTKLMYEHQQNEEPVHKWSDLKLRQTYIFECDTCPVNKMMITDIYTVHEDEPLCMVKSIMQWKGIRHLPVENIEGELVGLVTATNLRDFEQMAAGWEQLPIGDFMVRDLITVTEDTPLHSIAGIMKAQGVGSVLIVHGKKLVGILTETDIKVLEEVRGNGQRA